MPARLLNVTVARRTCASKSIGKERGSSQVKSMSNALGKTGRCLVGVVLFARLDFPVFAGTLPLRQRPEPSPPNRDVWVRTVRKSRPPFTKQSEASIKHCVSGLRVLCLFLFLFFFLIFAFLETGKVKTTPPPNGHARILANAEIYGRSLNMSLHSNQ